MERIKDTLDYQIIPALPGYFVRHIGGGEIGEPIPVIAWVISRTDAGEGEYWWDVHPVLPNEVMEGWGEWCIQMPDGNLSFLQGESSVSLEQARKDIAKQHAAFQEWQAREKAKQEA